jgi:L-2-hydroxyglutarate oxidase LhgO
MEKVEITIIGAGVVGLAIAYELSKNFKKDILLIERHESFGKETSSRNSEVIHSGIYYPKDSLKAKLCVEGKNLLYKFCEENSIPYKKCGKLIVAVDNSELENLNFLYENGKNNGVDDLQILDKNQLKKLIPELNGESAIFSPSTGILDTHKFMQKLEFEAKQNGCLFLYNNEVVEIEKLNSDYKLVARNKDSEITEVVSEIIINSAGLSSDKIAKMLGINDYKLYYCKGEYFKLSSKYKDLTNYLLYPVVDKNFHSLGIHTVIDLSGNIKLGPNSFYVDTIDYSVDLSHIDEFYYGIKKFFSFVQKEYLSADTSGIRPKLQGPKDNFKDFVIKEEVEKGFKNFINLVGIESPGLTSSLAIGKYVSRLLVERVSLLVHS